MPEEHDRGGTDFIVRELQRRVDQLEIKVDEIERSVLTNTIKITEGLTGGASQQFKEVHALLSGMQHDLNALERKTTKWEGGGGVLYALSTVVGGVLGAIAVAWFGAHK